MWIISARRPTRNLVRGALLMMALGCTASERAESTAEPDRLDARTPVELPAEADDAVRREMRAMLAALSGAMAATVRGDTAALLAALAPGGTAAAADPEIEALLPEAWKELAERTHAGFDSLSLAVRRTQARASLSDTVLTRLAHITATCSACHAEFRLRVR